MWPFGGSDDSAKTDTSLKDENAALKAEIVRLRRDSSAGGAMARRTSTNAGAPPQAQPQQAATPPQQPASQPVAASSEPTQQIRVGALMVVCGLKNRPELNGRLARVVSHDAAKGTWSTIIAGTDKRFALRPANLQPAKATPSTLPPELVLRSDAKKKAATTREPTAGTAANNGWGFRSVNGEAKPTPSSRTADLSATERSAVRQRLYASHKRGKAPADGADGAGLDGGAESPDGALDGGVSGVSELEERPPFVVPVGKRRVRTARAPNAQRTNREKPTTNRGTPTTWANVNRNAWEGRTTSPTGRFHQDAGRRADVRGADLHSSINYYATTRTERVFHRTGDNVYEAPDNDRKMKESSFLTSQAWFESLRHYPRGKDGLDDQATYSGYTHGANLPAEHLETDVRTRMGIGTADPSWRPQQLQEAWAPEPAALADRLVALRARLRGVPIDSEEIAAAGRPQGPDLWV